MHEITQDEHNNASFFHIAPIAPLAPQEGHFFWNVGTQVTHSVPASPKPLRGFLHFAHVCANMGLPLHVLHTIMILRFASAALSAAAAWAAGIAGGARMMIGTDASGTISGGP